MYQDRPIWDFILRGAALFEGLHVAMRQPERKGIRMSKSLPALVAFAEALPGWLALLRQGGKLRAIRKAGTTRGG